MVFLNDNRILCVGGWLVIIGLWYGVVGWWVGFGDGGVDVDYVGKVLRLGSSFWGSVSFRLGYRPFIFT